jgi:hypothetical protein
LPIIRSSELYVQPYGVISCEVLSSVGFFQARCFAGGGTISISTLPPLYLTMHVSHEYKKRNFFFLGRKCFKFAFPLNFSLFLQVQLAVISSSGYQSISILFVLSHKTQQIDQFCSFLHTKHNKLINFAGSFTQNTTN